MGSAIHGRTIRPVRRLAGRAASSLVLVLAATVVSAAAGRPMRFERYSVEQGLSQSSVMCVFQDSRGFIWLGTEDGLNRFDGYSFHVYRHDVQDSDALPGDYVWEIEEDASGDLWLATEDGGLARWSRAEDRFVAYPPDPSGAAGPADGRLRTLLVHEDGSVWVGTRGAGLSRFDPAAESWQVFRHDPADPESLSHDAIYALLVDRNGNLWVGTDGGLDRFDAATGSFRRYAADPGEPRSGQVRALIEDREGRLWIGTFGGGLGMLGPDGERIEWTRHDASDPRSLADDFVHAVLEDRSGRLWVGTREGLELADADGFEHYGQDPLDVASLGDDEVMSLFEDAGGVLWVGTRAAGVHTWNPNTWAFGHVSAQPGDPSGLSADYVTSFAEDAAGRLWIGTLGGGLNALNRANGRMVHIGAGQDGLTDDRVMALVHGRDRTLWVGTMQGGLLRRTPGARRFEAFRHDPADPRSLTSDGVVTLLEDSSGALWIGTYKGGLNRRTPGGRGFDSWRHDPDDPASLGADTVTALAEDASGALWVGTEGGGLSLLDPSAGTVRRFQRDDAAPTSLSDDTVYTLSVDARGTLWVGTRAGLSRLDALDPASGAASFRTYTASDGLPNDVIYGIEPDGAGRLWLSTNQGLVRFDPRTESFRAYRRGDGLQGDEFNFGAHHRSPRGELFFGGPNGFNAFFPERLPVNDHVPPVVLTNVLKFNRPVTDQGPVNELRELELGYRDAVVSFEFAALDFADPSRNRYLYRLDGFADEWIDLGSLRRVTFTNLDSGRYSLHVRAANADGVWNEEGLTLPLRVIPPPWQSGWAYLLYTLAVAGVGFAVLRAQRLERAREAEYRRRLETEVQQRTDELARQNTKLESLNEQLVENSLTDALTGLRNRRFLFEQVTKEMSLVERQQREAANGGGASEASLLFVMVDLDWFKPINDTCGHAAGDRVLVQMRRLLEKSCRNSDVLIRWGGDEFLVVGRTRDLEDIDVLPERIRATIEATGFDLGDGQVAHLTCSIGFTTYPGKSRELLSLSLEQVVALADRALYAAKRAGRNAWVGLLGREGVDGDSAVRWLESEPDDLAEIDLFDVRRSTVDAGEEVVRGS